MIGALQESSGLSRVRAMVDARGELQPYQEEEIGRTILVVEDDILVRAIIADKLREVGFIVIEAAGPDEALDVLAHRFDVKMVLSDVEMSGSIDGVGLARVVRSAYPAIKIVLTSGRVAAVNDAEHDGFFPKPYDAAQIIRYIRELLG